MLNGQSKLRVLKFWEGLDTKKSITSDSDTSVSGLDYILVDQKGNCVHAKVMKSSKQSFKGKLEEHKTYIISKMSVYKSELRYRLTKHQFMVFFNAKTNIQEVDEIATMPKFSFDFIKLNTLADQKENIYLNAVIGILIESSETKEVSDKRIIRELGIQDETANNVRVVLWGNLAINFEKPANLAEKPVFIPTSTSVDFYNVTKKYTVASRDSSVYNFDLDIPEVRSLKNSQIEVGDASERNEWISRNKKTIVEMINEYIPNSSSVLYTCSATFEKFEGKYTYPACKKCNKRIERIGGTLKCTKCPTPQPIGTAIVTRISIHDLSGSCMVTLFGNKVAEMLDKQLEEIEEFEEMGLNLGELFEEAKAKEFIFEIKMSTYRDDMWLTITKSKVVHVIPDLDDSENGDDITNAPQDFHLVEIKQEKDADNVQATTEAHPKICPTTPQAFEMVKIKQEKDDHNPQFTTVAYSKKKRQPAIINGNKESPTKKSTSSKIKEFQGEI